MKNKIRILRQTFIGIFGIFILLVIAFFDYKSVFSSRASYQKDLQQALQNSALVSELAKQECQLWDGDDGIAHIKGNSELQTYSCWGYLHARDRAGQIDFLRRVAYSRKAEVAGAKEIKSDFFIKTIGIAEKAQELYKQMPDSSKNYLIAYSYGVNRGLLENIENKKVYEFENLEYFPEPWKPEDSVALLLLQSLEQTKENFLRKLDEESWKNEFGEKADTMFAKNNIPWETFIIKDNELNAYQKAPQEESHEKAKATAVKTRAKSLDHLKSLDHSQSTTDPKALKKITEVDPTEEKVTLNLTTYQELRSDFFREENWGSNNWVLAPIKTKQKNSWLANDPHLSLKYPPFWYWTHIQSNDFNSIGANLPGVPVFANAVTEKVAWGLTNSYMTVSRLYFVKKKEISQASTHLPLIWIKWWKFKIPFFFKTFQRINNRWPVLPLELHPDYSTIYHWSSLDLEAQHISPVFNLVKSKNIDEVDKIFSQFKLNSWNFVFSDLEGHIGYRAIGLVHRLKEKPVFGIERTSAEQALKLLSAKDYLNPDEIPHLKNPVRGYISTANNRQWNDKSAAFKMDNTGNSEFRAYRIEQLLKENRDHVNLDSMKKVQCDIQAQDARTFLPLLISLYQDAKLSADQKTALDILKHWNLQTDVNCNECFLYRRWMNLIYKKHHLNVIAFYHSLNKENFKEAPPYLDELQEAYGEYKSRITSGESWGQVHVNYFSHLWGDLFAEKSPIATPGDDETVNPGTSKWDGKVFQHLSGASQRLVVEMSNPPQVYSILAGENVNKENPSLNDLNLEWKKWSNCQLTKKSFPLNWKNIKPQRVQL